MSWGLGRGEFRKGGVEVVEEIDVVDEEDMSARSFTARECVGAGLARFCFCLFRRFHVILPNTDV